MTLEKQIEILRKRLNKSIENKGVNSKETMQISEEVDYLINKYYYINKKE